MGHFHPLVPLARAFVDAGHDLVFATASPASEGAVAAGFEVLEAGIGQPEAMRRLQHYRPGLLELPPGERRVYAFTTRFGLVDAPAKVGELRGAAAACEPDLVVHDSSDLAAPIVAAALGVPSVNHGFGRIVPRACYESAADATDSLWRDAGLEPEPLCGAYRGAYVDICPPSFQSVTVPAGTRRLLVQPLAPISPGETAPEWLAALSDRPTVYVTLGTVFNDPKLFRILLDGVANVSCNAVATVGKNVDPSALGSIPANTRVERYVPQALLLPYCAATIGHGGSGSTLAALAHGVPLLLVPQAADQFENAAHCAAIGVGRVLMPDELTAGAVQAALVAVLEKPSYRERAHNLAAEIAAMPSPDEVVLQLLH